MRGKGERPEGEKGVKLGENSWIETEELNGEKEELRIREWLRYVFCFIVGEREQEEDMGALQFLLATDSGQLQVFQDSCLKWAATLPHPPTDIAVATLQSVHSVITLGAHAQRGYGSWFCVCLLLTFQCSFVSQTIRLT